VACCRRKRCCFAKSAPRPRASPTQNIYDLQPVADSSSTSSGQGTTDSPVSTTPSAAATDGRIYYDDSVAGSAGFAATTADCTTTRWLDPVKEPMYCTMCRGMHPVRRTVRVPPDHQQAQRQDTGVTLVENTLYDSSGAKPNNDAVYANAAFHADNSHTE